jgi:hypothetical protein
MENLFLIAAIVSIVYFLLKFIEMRFLLKESKPLKLLIRDTLVVYFSVLAGTYISNQVTPLASINESINEPSIFTNDVDF